MPSSRARDSIGSRTPRTKTCGRVARKRTDSQDILLRNLSALTTNREDLRMSRTVVRWLVGGLGVLLTAIPLLAHHNITGKFDPARTRTLNGVVTRLDWANPHVHIL